MNNLPSWIHPALIQANIEAQERKLWKTNLEQNNPNVENHINWTKIWIEKVTSLEEKQEKIKNSSQRAPSKSIKWLLDFLWINSKEFKWKNVVDLWWWFWWLAKNIVNYANNITIVDPIFLEKNINDILNKNIIEQVRLINAREDLVKSNPNVPKETPNSIESKKVLEEMKWWINYTKENFPNVERNPSYAEKIVWIENNSQDYVFCNYVLSKETIDIEDAIKELNRILKSGWKIIYSDYEKDEKLLTEFKKYFKLEIIYDEKNWIIIICTK